jgi:hypothetical protein
MEINDFNQTFNENETKLNVLHNEITNYCKTAIIELLSKVDTREISIPKDENGNNKIYAKMITNYGPVTISKITLEPTNWGANVMLIDESGYYYNFENISHYDMKEIVNIVYHIITYYMN